jgi:hypothetical protein
MARALSFAGAAFLAFSLGLAGCASVPPPDAQLAEADLALRNAEQVDAAHHAPLDMREARDQYDEARRLAQDDENLEARRLAESAAVRAELAATRARAARSRAAADEIRESIESLRSEAQRGADRVK